MRIVNCDLYNTPARVNNLKKWNTCVGSCSFSPSSCSRKLRVIIEKTQPDRHLRFHSNRSRRVFFCVAIKGFHAVELSRIIPFLVNVCVCVRVWSQNRLVWNLFFNSLSQKSAWACIRIRNKGGAEDSLINIEIKQNVYQSVMSKKRTWHHVNTFCRKKKTLAFGGTEKNGDSIENLKSEENKAFGKATKGKKNGKWIALCVHECMCDMLGKKITKVSFRCRPFVKRAHFCNALRSYRLFFFVHIKFLASCIRYYCVASVFSVRMNLWLSQCVCVCIIHVLRCSRTWGTAASHPPKMWWISQLKPGAWIIR